MNDFKKNFKPRGKSFGPGADRPRFVGGFAARRSEGRPERPPENFKTDCSKCHAPCEVPFRPNGKKPVYCRDCFVRDDAAPRGNDRFEKRSFGPEKRSYDTPRAAAPVEDPRIGAMQKELTTIHAKLDTLIATLQGGAYDSIISTASEREEEKPAKKVAKAAVKKVAKKKAA